MDAIDWSNPKAQISEHFTVHELLWLNQWNRLAADSDGLNDQIKQNLVLVCQKLELIRNFFNSAVINVNSGYRPSKYSLLVGGFATDVHTLGMACDFTISAITCTEVKTLLLSKLIEFSIRMEDNGLGNWIHVDIHPVIHNRFFKP